MLQISAFTNGTFVSSLDVQSAIFENEVRGSSLWLDVYRPKENEVMLFNRFVHEVPPTDDCFVFPIDSFKTLKRLVMCRTDGKTKTPNLIADATILVADDLIVSVRSQGFYFNELIEYVRKSNLGRMPVNPAGLYELFPTTFFSMFTSDLKSSPDIDIYSEQYPEYCEDIAFFKQLNWTLREITIPVQSIMRNRESGSLTMSIMASAKDSLRDKKTKEATPSAQAAVATPMLKVVKGDDVGKIYKLEKTPIRIGRDVGNDILVISNGVSRKHAIITIEGRKVLLTDLGSTNGTFVNAKRIQQVQLKPGDQIFLGNSILVFQS